jgi:4-amino-4-deoxy-L-arabinose transferase-like glycosyltransferase
VALVFGLPLFLGLNHRDLHNDEASYSYGVQHILETGEWLTIRGTPQNLEFLEKPPLKFWMVAAGMRLGVLPETDAGMRRLDALFGTLMFVYVYLLGARIRGPIAGFVSALVLFTFAPIVLDHGLRSNNMEAALTLAYCAGFYHFLAWCEATPATARRHAVAFALAIVLGFMTKFIVIVFLPAGACLLLLTHPRRSELLSAVRLREWLVPAAVATVLIAPWFIYQTWRMGAGFWQIILGQQVLQRMSSGLDASHLEPPSFYIAEIWRGFSGARTVWLVVAGLVWSAVASVRRDGTWGRLILVWALLPLAAISVSHSKIIHYAYPFVPPLALAAGWMLATAIRWFIDAFFADVMDALPGSRRRQTLFALGLLALVIGGLTWSSGRLIWHLPNGVISNASVLRPVLVASVLMWFAVRRLKVLLLVPSFLVIGFLPIPAYARELREIDAIYRPLAAVNACLRDLRAQGETVPSSTSAVPHYPPTHAYYYYLREFGPYRAMEADDATLVSLVTASSPAMLIFERNDYWAWRDRVGDAVPVLPALVAEDNHVLVLPGAAGACVAPAVRVGAMAQTR